VFQQKKKIEFINKCFVGSVVTILGKEDLLGVFGN